MNVGEAREIVEVERAETLKRLDALVDEFNGIVAASMDANADDEHDPKAQRSPANESARLRSAQVIAGWINVP